MQSSTYMHSGHPHIAALAVDGNTDPVFDHRSCSSTNKTYEPWWAVDLLTRFTVFNVSLTNRFLAGKVLLSLLS